jgi:two-component system, NtrC family, sensor kinase
MEQVLIIGDVEGLRTHLKKLEAAGELEIHTVENGYEALEAVENLRPAIAFTSSTLVGLDGIQLLCHLREVDPDLEVIFITEPKERHLLVEALEIGAGDAIARPLSEKAVEVLLQRARQKIWTRKRLVEALAEIQTRQHFEYKLIQTSMDGIIANDRQGNIILFNEGAGRIYGFVPEEAVARVHVTRLYPEGEARTIKKMIYGPGYGGPGKLINYETRGLAKDGRLVPILLSATLIFEGDEEVATVGYFKDLTHFRREAG